MKNFVFTFLLIGIFYSASAQDLSWLGWDNLRQHNPVLPAQIKQDTGLTIVIPGASLTAMHSGPAIGDYFLRQGNGVFSLDFTDVIDELEDMNGLAVEVKVPVFAIDVRKKDHMFSVGYGVNAQSAVSYHKDFINLYQYGNADYIGETMDLSHQLGVSSYHQLHVGYVRSFGGVNIGGRLKLISGIADISTPLNEMGLYTNPDIYQLSLTSPNGIVFNTSEGIDYNGIDDINIDYKAISFKNIGKNLGYGLDLGIYGKSDKITYALSVLDLGKINWSNNSTEYRSQPETIYEGLDLLDFFSDENDIVVEDSLKALLDLEEDSISYSTNLRLKANAMIGLDISDAYGIALFYNRNSSQNNFDSFGLINKFRFGNSQVNLMVTALSGKFYVGLGGALSLGPVQLIASADNILGIVDMDKTNYASARVGLNISLAQKKKPLPLETEL